MHFVLAFLLYSSLILFTACGGDSGSNGSESAENANSADIITDSFDELPVCTAKRDGVIAYIKDEKTAYACIHGDWVVDDGSLDSRIYENDDGNSSSSYTSFDRQSSSSNNEESSSSFVYEQNCSAILEGHVGWDFYVPKDCRFNPTITYGSFTETAERGGQTYRTVTIGEGENAQTWMAENLNYYKASDITLNGYSRCYGAVNSENTANCPVTGRFYNWAAAMGKSEDECGEGNVCNLGEGNIQGVCPDGWHLPRKEEWELLFINVGGKDNAGKILKSQTGWEDWNGVNGGNGIDSYGFSALPSGCWYDGSLGNAGYCTLFWSATEYDSRCAYRVYLDFEYDSASLSHYNKNYRYSIRCLKD